LSLLEKAVNTFEGRFTARVLRTLPSLRRRLSAEALGKILATVLPQGNGTRKSLARYVGEGEAQTTTTTTTITPEAETYLTLLVIVHLIDVKELHKVCLCSVDAGLSSG
jgi:26S proteasome regulatory subunit N3